MAIDISERLELLKLEMQLLQQRLAKYDDLIWTVRGWAVTLTVALTSWASAKLGDPAAMAWILRTATVVPALFWIEEGVLRAGYVAKYIDRYRLIRSALNDSAPDLETLPLYDLTGHYAGLTPPLRRLLRSFLRVESTFLYLALIALPLLFMLLLPMENAQPKGVQQPRCAEVANACAPCGLVEALEPLGGKNQAEHCLVLASNALRCL